MSSFLFLCQYSTHVKFPYWSSTIASLLFPSGQATLTDVTTDHIWHKKNNRLPQPADHETIAIYDTKAYTFRETLKAETNYRPQRITGRIGNFRQHMIKERNKTITKTKWHNAQLRTIRGTQTREKKKYS